MGKINSRAKGARGELELAEVLRQHGYTARRGQQFSGGTDSPDVVHDMGPFHVECKRVEKGNLYDWLEQAQRDAGAKRPLVVHRRSRKEWVAIMPLEDLLDLLVFVPDEAIASRKRAAEASPERRVSRSAGRRRSPASSPA